MRRTEMTAPANEIPAGPELAVVIVSVGAPAELAGAVRSLLGQSPPPEIVVVNSGGGDARSRIGPICPQVPVLDFPRPLQPGVARNRGIEATTAPFVAFLAADCEAEPGWVAARLARHREGAAIVCGPVVGRLARSVAARAAWLAAFSSKLPGLPAGLAHFVGASFARALLPGQAPFREDLRIGDEAELMLRLPDGVLRVWAPEVRTAHRGPATLKAALRARYEDGLRQGYFLARTHKGRLPARLTRRVATTFSRLHRGLEGFERVRAWLHAPAICAMLAAFELGVRDAARLRNAARLASERGEHDQVLLAYRRIWERTGDGEALGRIADVLISLGRGAEALDAIETAGRGPVPERIYLIALARYHQARYDWASLVALLDRHPEQTAREIVLLGCYLAAVSALGRPEAALTAIAAYRGTVLASAHFLRIEALFRCRRYDEAWCSFAALDAPIRKQMPRDLIGSLFATAFISGGSPRAKAFLDEVVPASPAGAPHALSGLFYRARLESHAEIERGAERIAAPAIPMERRVRDNLDPGDRHSPQLVEACARFDRLRRDHDAFHPDPSFVVFDAVRVAQRIAEAVRLARPLSLIRLGDGEGNLLPYRPSLAAYQALDYRTTYRAWWGDMADSGTGTTSLRQALVEAIDGADIIGIPDLHRMGTTLGTGKNARGLIASIDFVGNRHEADPAWLAGRLITSCHVHQSLAYWRLWDALIPPMREISLITCHPGLADTLAQRHGVGISAVHLIPAEAKYADAIKAGVHAPHYPDRFGELMEILAVPQAGRVFLVAAGILGKVYCHVVRQQGGIALDIGSLADAWAGYETRSLEEVSNYLVPDDAGLPKGLKDMMCYPATAAEAVGTAHPDVGS